MLLLLKKIGFKQLSKSCCCPGGKIDSSTYCSSKLKLPCKGLECQETWDPWRLLSIVSHPDLCPPPSFPLSLFISINVKYMYSYKQYIYTTYSVCIYVRIGIGRYKTVSVYVCIYLYTHMYLCMYVCIKCMCLLKPYWSQEKSYLGAGWISKWDCMQ